MAGKTKNNVRDRISKGNRTKIEKPMEFPLQKLNFRLMAIATLTIVTGFLLMLGPGATEESFNPEIFSTRRIIVGPTIAFIGFLFMGFAIIYRGKTKKQESENREEIEI